MNLKRLSLLIGAVRSRGGKEVDLTAGITAHDDVVLEDDRGEVRPLS